MSQLSRIFFLILSVLFFFSSPAITGEVDFIEEVMLGVGFFEIAILPLAWMSILALQISSLLRVGKFIYVLFILYLGGRLKNKRFNDRNIHPIYFLIVILFKATLFRAALNFSICKRQFKFKEMSFYQVV